MRNDNIQMMTTRRVSGVLALVVIAVVLGVFGMAFTTYTGADAVSIAISLAFLAMPLLRRAWRLGSTALHDPSLDPPEIPYARRLCPVCGSLLRRGRAGSGWVAACPACTFVMPLGDGQREPRPH